jgi:anthranilate synthase/aminodeoxychorismate synthase-like glutamine amidotransferase
LKVLVIDNFDSFVYNITQYIGELGGTPTVYRNNEITAEEVDRLSPDKIILSPGPGTPSDPRYFGNCLSILQTVSTHVPTLGVCLGHQGIVYAFGGEIVRAQKLMHGKTSWVRHDGKGIFHTVENPLEATRYHSLVANLFSLPECLKPTAYSLDDCEIMGVRHTKYPIEGVQFHPESILTGEGKKILSNFVEGGCSNDH